MQSLWTSLSLPAEASASSPTAQPTDIASIQRALGFVIRTDQLIWRRRGSSGPKTLKLAAVFDGENINALTERLELWERVIRTPRS